MILGQVVERNAQLYPEQTALIFEGRAINQRDWAALMRRSAQALAALGIKRHGRVAILAKNSPEYLALYLAAGLAGFTAIGINYRLSGPEQAQIVRDCEPQVLLFDAEHAAAALALRAVLPAGTALLCLDAQADGALPWQQALAAASDARARRAHFSCFIAAISVSGSDEQSNKQKNSNRQFQASLPRRPSLIFASSGLSPTNDRKSAA